MDFLNQNNGEAVYDKEVEQEIISTQAQLTSGSSDYMERDEFCRGW